MSEKKELNNEELEKVTGGNWFSKIWENAKNTVQQAVSTLTEDDNAD